MVKSRENPKMNHKICLDNFSKQVFHNKSIFIEKLKNKSDFPTYIHHLCIKLLFDLVWNILNSRLILRRQLMKTYHEFKSNIKTVNQVSKCQLSTELTFLA